MTPEEKSRKKELFDKFREEKKGLEKTILSTVTVSRRKDMSNPLNWNNWNYGVEDLSVGKFTLSKKGTIPAFYYFLSLYNNNINVGSSYWKQGGAGWDKKGKKDIFAVYQTKDYPEWLEGVGPKINETEVFHVSIDLVSFLGLPEDFKEKHKFILGDKPTEDGTYITLRIGSEGIYSFVDIFKDGKWGACMLDTSKVFAYVKYTLTSYEELIKEFPPNP
jgi:hypothetical protein